eukprot:6248861-Lingulodinium_polyedra.AAC.1
MVSDRKLARGMPSSSPRAVHHWEAFARHGARAPQEPESPGPPGGLLAGADGGVVVDGVGQQARAGRAGQEPQGRAPPGATGAGADGRIAADGAGLQGGARRARQEAQGRAPLRGLLPGADAGVVADRVGPQGGTGACGLGAKGPAPRICTRSPKANNHHWTAPRQR